MAYDLAEVATECDWQEYHSIRRTVLWERRGLTNYADNHPDEYNSANHPLLFRFNDRPIGTVRLDHLGDRIGAVRLVAIRPDFQGQGHGRALSNYVEEYARRLGIRTLYVNAAPEAAGYYEKLGWKQEIWNEAELVGIASECLQMSKQLVETDRLLNE